MHTPTLKDPALVRSCIAIDLEVGRESDRIHRFAAIRGDRLDARLVGSGANVGATLRKVDEFARGMRYVAGHNILGFDLPHLRAAMPGLALLELPVIDTLRLSPLAFPKHPYHALVKHYKDGALVHACRNDPELDARLCLTLLADEERAFRTLEIENPPLASAFHWLCGKDPEGAGFNGVFEVVRGAPRPRDEEGRQAVLECLERSACKNATRRLMETLDGHRWPIAYCLAWLSVAGGNSVMPPWVRHTYPEAARIVRRLRDVGCGDPSCPWCEAHHNPRRVLERWFGFDGFRATPACEDGRSMQEAIVEASMGGEHVLGILPTGTGKSICYQVPALSRYENTGALTIVISPLVALMADQIHGLLARGIQSCAALNGLLSMPERADALERVRLGDVAILLVSPEQLRNRAFRRAIEQREIASWVLDEAHCLSKWGHDFRPDYRYIARFIEDRAGDEPTPPVLCLTATAKPDVVAEIRGYFLSRLGIELRVFDGGAMRVNLDFVVQETTAAHKVSDIHLLLESHLEAGSSSGAIVYCATRKQTEEMAGALAQMGWSAGYFHAGLPPETKKNTQQDFITGALRVIVATNAFGMGIDKPDVRLVVHADIPGSIENYVQEAGRTGRDGDGARCVLLYCDDDVERQFGMSARSRLTLHEIQAVLRAVRRMAGKHRNQTEPGEVVATPGEILTQDEDREFIRDSNTDDTRVRTAIAWLEEARLLRREENRYEVFPSSLRVDRVEDAEKRLEDVPMPYRGQLCAIVRALLETDEALSTDELMGMSGLSSSGVAHALRTLERQGVLSDDSVFTALVHAGVANSSADRLQRVAALESKLIEALQELEPDLQTNQAVLLHLRRVSQVLKDGGEDRAHPQNLLQILRGWTSDEPADGAGRGSIRLKKADGESYGFTLLRSWDLLRETARRRQASASLILSHLLACLPDGLRGTDLFAKTTLGKIHDAVESDLVLSTQTKDINRLVERSALWLHEQEVIRLGRGMIVFRPAMTIRIAPGNSPFLKSNFTELNDHYDEQIVQIHVMAEYARRGLGAAGDAMRMVSDYFSNARDAFLRLWFPKNPAELRLQTGSNSWKKIVNGLNHVQRELVTDDRERMNVLVLAGPGSGKTRTLVHRIAYLIRVRRERAEGIVALAYNRHAAVEIRRRLFDLIGNDALGVTVLTCHALAMRLTGRSFSDIKAVDRETRDAEFRKILADAAELLKGGGQVIEEADALRDKLLAGFRWILVDEYQDIGREQYELISALAGRTLSDPDQRLSLFAVGDDDQNIYTFAGASVEFIRRFTEDYGAKPAYLVDNYRSSTNIIDAANALIAPAANRMKREHAIAIDDERRSAPGGGKWEKCDPVARGRVQVLRVQSSLTDQAEAIMLELLRLSTLDPDWDWCRAAVIAREWRNIDPVQAFCETRKIPVQRASDDTPQFWRMRETQSLVDWLEGQKTEPTPVATVLAWLEKRDGGCWWEILREAAQAYQLEYGDVALPASHIREWLAEWGREIRRRQRGLLLLTAHSAKGLEFDHVAVLDGGWDSRNANDDPDAERRLLYVAMTRARQTLTLASMNNRNGLLRELLSNPAVFNRDAAVPVRRADGLDRSYRYLSMRDVDLSYAGRCGPGAAVHAAIRALRPGDPLSLVTENGRRVLEDRTGCPVGCLAKGYRIPPGKLECASVHAVVVRRSEDGKPEHADALRCGRWEVVVPTFVFRTK